MISLTFCLLIFNQVQRHLQLRIEAQGKYLQGVLEKAQVTLERQNLGTAGLEVAKVQLSELASKVSDQCIESAFSEMKELHALWPQQTQVSKTTDCSLDSSLTSCEGPQRDQETHNKGFTLRTYNGTPFLISKEGTQEPMLLKSDLKLCDHVQEKKVFLSPSNDDAEKRNSGLVSMNVGLRGDESFGMRRERCENEIAPVKLNNDKISRDYRLSSFEMKLDLNAHDENDASSHCQQFDLNGFGWNC